MELGLSKLVSNILHELQRMKVSDKLSPNKNSQLTGDFCCLLFVMAEDMRERGGKGCCTLNACKMNLANV